MSPLLSGQSKGQHCFQPSEYLSVCLILLEILIGFHIDESSNPPFQTLYRDDRLNWKDYFKSMQGL